MGSVGSSMVVEGDPGSDGVLCLRSCFPGVQIDAFILQRSPQTLNEDIVDGEAIAERPLPSMEIRMPTRFRRSVQAKDVNCEPWSVFMIPGAPKRWMASFSASTRDSRLPACWRCARMRWNRGPGGAA